jgi:hypothetical protein
VRSAAGAARSTIVRLARRRTRAALAGALLIGAALPAPAHEDEAGEAFRAAEAGSAAAEADRHPGDAHHGDSHPGGPAPSGADGAAARAALERATRALERFQDPRVAEAEGWRAPRRNDGFQMGEHWFHPEILRAGRCELERPGFLQYLVIDGRRTLIGTGHVCDVAPGAPPPDWFGPGVNWHRHGPALCETRRGAFLDFQFLAQALPNARSESTWRDLCGRLRGTPRDRHVAMLHTWNWIAAPDGPFVHENRAIPFLRAGLRVRPPVWLDAPEGADALATLRLAHGDLAGRWRAAWPVAGAGWTTRWRARRVLRRAEAAARDAASRMRSAERLGDDALYASAARAGAAAAADASAQVAALLDPEGRRLAERFLASLVVHDHP